MSFNRTLHRSLRGASLNRNGFSLLEIIIATAILAGSSMVLISMIGAGSRFGQQAEQKTIALAAANSLIDEMIATNKFLDSSQETTGTLGSSDPLGFRIRISTYTPQSENMAEPIAGLMQITVEMYGSEAQIADAGRPICTLTRIVRAPPSKVGQ
jgi:prepilin-type N-terminal cleavage/methylation domain-containing protein